MYQWKEYPKHIPLEKGCLETKKNTKVSETNSNGIKAYIAQRQRQET